MSKASRRRRSKAGRKRIVGVTRTRSGRISRSRETRAVRDRLSRRQQEEAEAKALARAIEVRQRVFGISEIDARDQKSATVLGRLALSGEINERQYDAGVTAQALHDDYLRAIAAPQGLRSGEKSSKGGEISDDYAVWSNRTRQAHGRMIEALLAANADHREANVPAAVEYILWRDHSLPHLTGDLRIALNALIHHFRLDGRVKAGTDAAGRPEPPR